MTSTKYFPRHLCIENDQGRARKIDEGELIATVGPKIILGEPGIGKSALIQELGNKLGVKPVPAARFMLSGYPSRFITMGSLSFLIAWMRRIHVTMALHLA